MRQLFFDAIPKLSGGHPHESELAASKERNQCKSAADYSPIA